MRYKGEDRRMTPQRRERDLMDEKLSLGNILKLLGPALVILAAIGGFWLDTHTTQAVQAEQIKQIQKDIGDIKLSIHPAIPQSRSYQIDPDVSGAKKPPTPQSRVVDPFVAKSAKPSQDAMIPQIGSSPQP